MANDTYEFVGFALTLSFVAHDRYQLSAAFLERTFAYYDNFASTPVDVKSIRFQIS